MKIMYLLKKYLIILCLIILIMGIFSFPVSALDDFEGKWVGTYEVPGHSSATGSCEINGNHISFDYPVDPYGHFEGTIHIDKSKNPKHIDITITSNSIDTDYNGKISHGIYKFDGSVLKIAAYPVGNDSRPTSFDDGAKLELKKIVRKALLIGCWNYLLPHESLPSSKNNLNSIKNLLHYGFDFDIDNIKICRNPDKQKLNTDIDFFKTQTNYHDCKFIYYSGHGGRMGDPALNKINEALLLPSNEKIYDYLDLSSQLNDINNLCSIFDCCYSGGICHLTDETEDYYKNEKGLNGISGINKLIGMAAEANKSAYHDEDDSIFTWYFIEAFTQKRDNVKSKIPGDNSRVSVEEALDFAKERTETVTMFEDNPQKPQIYDTWSGQFYLSDEPINDYWSGTGHCPIHLHAYNSEGKHVGYAENGEIENQIPGVIYLPGENETIIVFDNENNSDIELMVDSYDDGEFTLECKNYDKETQITDTIYYEKINVVNGTKSYLKVKNSVFRNLEVDYDSDGKIDQIVTAENMLKYSNKIPSVKISNPTSGETVTDILTVKGNSSDSDGIIKFVEISIDSDEWIEAAETINWIYRLDTKDLENGLHTIRVRSYDGENYSKIQSVGFYIENEKQISATRNDDNATPGFEFLTLVFAIGVAFIFIRRRL